MLCAGEILKSGDGLLAAQVDDKQMGHCGRALCLPISTFLKVEHFVARVIAVIVLAVGILRGPRLARKPLAIGALQLDFGNGCLRFAVVG